MFPEIVSGLIDLGFNPRAFEAMPRTADIVEAYGFGCLSLKEAVYQIVGQIL